METREKILVHASGMFVSLGVKNVTMDLLATEMGVSKRTIYELFSDKEDLVIECIIYLIMETNKENLKLITESSNVVEALFLIMKRQEERRKLMPQVFQEDMKKYFPLAKARTFKDKASARKISAPFILLQKGMDQGIFRIDFKIELVDSYLFEMITIIHNSQLIRMLDPLPADVLNSIVLPYFRGLCTTKGQELMRTYFEDNNLYKNE
jgi:AcrR family transcriptional regulator